jgi:fumarate reductase flavoprotein subunit
LVRDFGRREQARLEAIAGNQGGDDAFTLMGEMRATMSDKVGIMRDGKPLDEAVENLQELLRRSRRVTLRHQARGGNPELAAAYRVQKMLKLALCVAHGAQRRTESRGAHYRADYPQRNDRDWLSRTLATWPDEQATLPELSYEALDVMRMELPPGWRGYGAKDHIDHPDTARRQGEVDAAKAASADRYAVQESLMPYEELLPERYRARNERLEEPDHE